MNIDNSNLDHTSPMQILIAEDNDVNRILIRKIFEKLNLPYDISVNGFQALEAFDSKFYDIVFMDIEMPGMDGFEVTKKLREKFKGQNKHPFIVALTANSLSGERQRCIDHGMNDYLSKPFSAPDVQRMVDKAREYSIR
jgi:CheY-like chemotaxis protein